MRMSGTSRRVLFPFVCLVLVLAGCEETANPFIGIDEPFTLYGYLNPRIDNQELRVIAIAQQLQRDEPPTIDAVVTSTDMATGEVIVWRDTYTRLEDGTFGHVFSARFRPAFDAAYRIDVRRSDGATSSVQVTTPVDVRVFSEDGPVTTVLLYHFEADAFPNVVQADMQYETARLQPEPSGLPPIFFPVAVSYRGKEERVEGGWRFSIDLRNDFREIQDTFDAHCLTREYISVRSMRFHVFLGDEAWTPPGDVFDPDVLAQPGTFSNVENGFGYVGAGYPITFDAIQPSVVLRAAGFTFVAPCASSPFFASSKSPECEVILPPC